ncbi:peptidoglycan DD-metalloendopeptidase family protein [Tissierellaceae bacterium HCP3S3_D8]
MRDRLLKTIKENGFLIFLFICVCLVAASTIFIATKEVDKPKDKKDLVILDDENKKNISLNMVSKEEEKDTIEANTIENADIEEKLEEENLEANLEANPEESKLEDGESEEVFREDTDIQDSDEIEFIDDRNYESVEKVNRFIMPADGEIITEFTEDSLIYSKTLDEWRGHSGIDIKLDIGTKVKAIGDGVVKDVYEDSLWGNVIVIDHGDGIESKYSNLGTRDMVNVGVKVKQGDHISTVGNSAGIEMLMDSHLHFEIIKDGKIVDPRSIMR